MGECMQLKKNKFLFLLLLPLLIFGCSGESKSPSLTKLKFIKENGLLRLKSHGQGLKSLEGTYLFSNTLIDVPTVLTHIITAGTIPMMPLGTDELDPYNMGVESVEFIKQEKNIFIQRQGSSDSLLSFGVKYYDVLITEKTSFNIEETLDQTKPWDQREFMEVNLLQNNVEQLFSPLKPYGLEKCILKIPETGHLVGEPELGNDYFFYTVESKYKVNKSCLCEEDQITKCFPKKYSLASFSLREKLFFQKQPEQKIFSPFKMSFSSQNQFGFGFMTHYQEDMTGKRELFLHQINLQKNNKHKFYLTALH